MRGRKIEHREGKLRQEYLDSVAQIMGVEA
jgi:hypothetical protein